MALRMRKACWFVATLILVAAVTAGLRLAEAQPGGGASKSILDTEEATFESLGEKMVINMSNVAYATGGNGFFDIYFTCSSSRGSDPLRLIDPADIKSARAYFNDEKKYGKHFVKIGRYILNSKNIAYVEFRENSATINFNMRIFDSFSQLTLTGADAAMIRKTRSR